jgi:hypothetical protein
MPASEMRPSFVLTSSPYAPTFHSSSQSFRLSLGNVKLVAVKPEPLEKARVRVSARNDSVALESFRFSFSSAILRHRLNLVVGLQWNAQHVKSDMVNQKVIDSKEFAVKVNLVNQNR